MKRSKAPADEAELVLRARRLGGRSVAWVAESMGAALPTDPRRSRGWAGMLAERVLGATAGSKAEPDFPRLQIELKTIPLDTQGRPRESTYVCTAPLNTLEPRWADSWVRHKLAAVLWVPIVGDAETPLRERVFGQAFLWRPTAEQEARLRADWESHRERIAGGEYWQISARQGAVLQIRPKGATARDMVWVQDDEAEWVQEQPRGFYLRARFTRELMDAAYG